MNNVYAPTRLDARAFAQASGQASGHEPLDRYARILEECQGRGSDLAVAWSARGEIRAGQPEEQVWLQLDAEVCVPLTCQRCLEVVDVPLRVKRSFRFVADEKTAALQDEESEEDLLAFEGDFNLHELIEDELVLELPMIARHEVCPSQTQPAPDTEFGIAVAGRPNPFAVLARLKSAE